MQMMKLFIYIYIYICSDSDTITENIFNINTYLKKDITVLWKKRITDSVCIVFNKKKWLLYLMPGIIVSIKEISLQSVQ